MFSSTNDRHWPRPSDRADARRDRYTNQPRPNSRWPDANLFRNPFGEMTRVERASLAVVNLDKMIASLTKTGPKTDPAVFRARSAYQLIGGCGRGKTTRMLALLQHSPTASYVYLPEDEPCPSIPDGRPLLIDEAQRMPAAVVRAVLRSQVPLVLATHRNLTRTLHRFGYRVNTEWIGQTLSPGLLCEILNRRLTASRRDPRQPVPQIMPSQCEALIRRFGTNIRAIEQYLYDVVQSQVNDHDEMRFID